MGKDLEHLQRHRQPRHCVRCKWAKHKAVYKPRLLLDVGAGVEGTDIDPALMSMTWVRIVKNPADGVYEFRCVCCKTFASRNRDFQILNRHHMSKGHRLQVAKYLGLAVGPRGGFIGGAPPAALFKRVWESAPRGQTGVEGASRFKASWIQRCLVQAIRERNRVFINNATTMVLLRDESKGTVILRARAASATLECKAMLIGMRTYTEGSAATDIADNTQAAIEEFCAGDMELYRHACNIVEAVCVDAASSETKSARMMKTTPAENPLTPNLKAVIRDRAHAARRLLSRPWGADEVIKSLTDEVVMARTSIVQRVRLSPLFTQWYKQAVQEEAGCIKATQLGAAKHRFESWQKPLAQLVLTLPAVIRVALQMAVVRRGKDEGKDAVRFLEHLSPERVLLLAMLADAADEALVVTRVFDTEDIDISTQHSTLEIFLERIWALFGDHPQCFELPGFTSATCNMLAEGVCYRTGARKEVRKLGGPGHPKDSVREKCLEHLRVWARLCVSIVKVEFPSMDLVGCFRAFDLSLSGGELAVDGELAASLRRLAHMLGLSRDNLTADFARCYKAAQAAFKQKRCSRQEAWTTAFRVLTGKRGQMRMPALGHVLQRYLGWGISTSGVEHSFARVRRLLEYRGSATADTKESWMVLSEPRPDNSECDSIIARAQEIWCEKYTKVARNCSHNALRTRIMRPSSSSDMSAPPTFASFLRRRRAASSSAAAAVADLAPAGDVARRVPAELRGDEVVQAGVKRELDHQTQRLAQRRAEAIGLGQLDVTEVSAEELKAACTINSRQQKLDMATESSRRRLRAISNPSPPNVDQVLDGMACYFAEEDLRRSLPPHIRGRARCVQNLAQADVVVAESVVLSQLPPRLQLAVCFAGCYVVTPAFFTGGRACLKMKGAMKAAWRLRLTDTFRAERANITNLLTALSARRGCNLKVLGAEDFAKAWAAASLARRKKFAVVRTKSAADTVELAGLPGDIAQWHFWDFVGKIREADPAQTVAK